VPRPSRDRRPVLLIAALALIGLGPVRPSGSLR
jgi:hypothetical protein